MQPHLLVAQLRFSRSEFVRCLEGVSDEDATRRLMPMNCIKLDWWAISCTRAGCIRLLGNLCSAKERCALMLYDLVGLRQTCQTPPLGEMWGSRQKVYCGGGTEVPDTLTPEIRQRYLCATENR